MTGNNNYENAQAMLDEHLQLIDGYIDSSNCNFSTYKERYKHIANLDEDTLGCLTRNELFDWSYLLYSYSSYLQDEVNKNRVILNWCNDQMNIIVARHRDDFDKYTKHEAKIPILVVENNYVAKLHELKVMAEAKLQVLEGKVFEIKRQGDVLLEKAKRQ